MNLFSKETLNTFWDLFILHFAKDAFFLSQTSLVVGLLFRLSPLTESLEQATRP